MDLIQVAEEGVETLFERVALQVHLAKAPLAEKGRRVTGCREHLRHGDIDIPHGLGIHPRAGGVAAHMRVAHVLPGHQHAPRRGAHGGSRIELREADSLGSHAVEFGRLDDGLSVRAEISVP